MTWIVACTQPYYPWMEEFNTREEADAYAQKWLSANGTEDGHHTVEVFVAEVTFKASTKTHY